MDWERAMREERAALMRIVALLCALAGQAEMAAGRSSAVRGVLLWLLRHAEEVARDFVLDEPDMQFVSMPPGPSSFGPAEAMRIAVSFRALARALERQAALMLVMRGEDCTGKRPRSSVAMPGLRALAQAMTLPAAFGLGMKSPPFDTS